VKPRLSDAAYVIFIEDRSTHKEVYFCGMEHGRPVRSEYFFDIPEAYRFANAREAHEVANMFAPKLESWRVGVRSG
jgi:hypothetical protein